jgi:formyltetrahydrofolate-dependent phosphoribosylglycinamide formyltransferase
MTTRVAVLASGGGSNLQAILDYFEARGERRAVSIALVASDRASAGALDRARRHGVPALALDAEQRTAGLAGILEQHAIEYVALAGYLRLVPMDVIHRWHGRIMNVHPSLLPSFGGTGMYGIRVHEAVIAAGVRVSGVTVQFVDEVYDRGPIIAQWPVPVLPDDTPETLAARVLVAEHGLYPRAIEAVADGRVSLGTDGRVVGLTAAPELATFSASFTAVAGSNQ